MALSEMLSLEGRKASTSSGIRPKNAVAHIQPTRDRPLFIARERAMATRTTISANETISSNGSNYLSPF